MLYRTGLREGGKNVSDGLRPYLDLLRLHFAPAWPLLFSSGTLLASKSYPGLTWTLVLTVVLIAFFGFSAGLVLNDYVDRDLDRRDVDRRLSRYWRPFGTRPVAQGTVSPARARVLAVGLGVLALLAILTLPFPHRVYVVSIMAWSYLAEYAYQRLKRRQRYPVAQVLGRTDFALFPVAGYLALGHPDIGALLYFVFFYPFALAHLGINDMADITNDRARGLMTIPVLYGVPGASRWVLWSSFVHGGTALLFASLLGLPGRIGLAGGLGLVVVANLLIRRSPGEDAALRALPCMHGAMVLYAGGIILDALV